MRIDLITRCIILSGLVALASCGMPASDDKLVAGSSSWPSCSWPTALDPDPSGSARDHCVAARTRLSCALPDGVTESCTTNDPMRCESSDAPDPALCHAECAQNEYSATCGGVGPGPIPAPPAGCHSGGLVPAGIVYYCCPCAS